MTIAGYKFSAFEGNKTINLLYVVYKETLLCSSNRRKGHKTYINRFATNLVKRV